MICRLVLGTSASLAAALLVVAPLAAQDMPRTTTVTARDLDLTSATGVATLDARLKVAIRKVCPRDWNMTLSQRALALRCEKETQARVAPQRATLIARAESHKGATLASLDIQLR